MSFTVPIAQDPLVELLTAQLKQGKVASSYLITAPPGFGKRALASAIACALECESTRYFEDCNCPVCRKVNEGIHPDVHWYDVEEGAYSVKKKAIDDLNHWVGLQPFEGRRKVFIIAHADSMTEEAANALLKTLEEPPADSHLILLVENKSRLLDTIISRCFELRMKPIPAGNLEKVLTREHDIGKEAHFLARWSGGSLGESLRLHEEGFCEIKNECLDSFLKEGPVSFFGGIATLQRRDLLQVLDIIFVFIRDLLIQITSGLSDVLVNEDRKEALIKWGQRLSKDDVLRMLRLLHETREAVSRNVNQKLAMNRLALEFLKLPVWSRA